MSNPITDFLTNRYIDGGGGINNLDWSNIAKDLGVAGAVYGLINPNDSSGIAEFFGTGGSQQPTGYTGGIPNYLATRELAPNAFAQTYTTPTGEIAPRRPGSAGRRYFTDTTFTQDTGTPFMGITAEQIAAQNQAAQDERDLFESILGGVETQRETAAAKQGTRGATRGGGTPITQVSTSDQYYTGDEKRTLYDAVLRGELTLEDIAYATGAPLSRVQEEYNRLASDAYPDTGDINDYISWASGQWINPESLVTGKQTQYFSPSQINPQETVINKVEAGNILRAAMEQGTSPEEVAAAINPVMPITEQGVVDWIKANYPNEAKDYLASYGYAAGGLASLGGKGYYLGGPTDGMADQIPATINNIEPAQLSDGEFVIPADVVSHLGNGNSDAGAQNLYSMMERVRRDRTGNPKQGKQIDPNKYLA